MRATRITRRALASVAATATLMTGMVGLASTASAATTPESPEVYTNPRFEGGFPTQLRVGDRIWIRATLSGDGQFYNRTIWTGFVDGNNACDSTNYANLVLNVNLRGNPDPFSLNFGTIPSTWPDGQEVVGRNLCVRQDITDPQRRVVSSSTVRIPVRRPASVTPSGMPTPAPMPTPSVPPTGPLEINRGVVLSRPETTGPVRAAQRNQIRFLASALDESAWSAVAGFRALSIGTADRPGGACNVYRTDVVSNQTQRDYTLSITAPATGTYWCAYQTTLPTDQTKPEIKSRTMYKSLR